MVRLLTSTLVFLVCGGEETLGFVTSSIHSLKSKTFPFSQSTWAAVGTSTSLFNVPPPGTDADPQTIKAASDREAPPQSFYQLQINCARAAELAIKDGHRLIEVEVSPLNTIVHAFI